MRLDVRNSSLVPWLGAISALITLGGLFVQLFGNKAFMAPLQASVPIPLWVLLATICFAYAASLFIRERIALSVERKNQALADANRIDAANRVKESHIQLAAVKQKLTEYQTLEREILGLLASGEELESRELVNRLGLSFKPNAEQMVRLAVASLRAQGKIVGTPGAITPKLRVAPR